MSGKVVPDYIDKFDLGHPHTMVVATNEAEFAYILAWCQMEGVLPPWLGDREDRKSVV